MKSTTATLLTLCLSGLCLWSCQNKESLTEDILEIETSTNTTNTIFEGEDMVAEGEDHHLPNGPIGEDARNAAHGIRFLVFNKLLKQLITETFIQGEIINLPGARNDYGNARTDCPETNLSDPTGYPTTMTLDYNTGCSPVTGLDVEGVLEVDFTGSVEEAGTEVKLRPQSGFKISGREISVSDACALTLVSIDMGIYTLVIADGEEIIMTDVNGAITSVDYVHADNVLLYDDNGTNSGPLDVLDDTFTFAFDEMSVDCGDGTSMFVVAEQELVYDLTCACVQDGVLNTFIGRDLFQTIDFGYPAVAGEEGECDDEILVTTAIDERTSNNDEVINCP